MPNRKKIAVTVLVAAIIGLCSFAFAAENEITMKGSTTVLPIAQATAEAFMEKNPQANISVQGGGSSVGVASLIDKTADIGNASRPMKDTELSSAVTNGVDPKANVIAMDGIAVIVNPSNTITAFTKKQIKDIYTGKVSDWSAVGGSGGKIVVVGRDTASGTYECFNEKALDKAKTRPDALLQASNQAVAQIVAQTPGAIGYVGLGFITDKVKAVTVEGIECTKETVLSGTYLLARPLFMYTNGKPQGIVAEYIDFVLSKEGQQIAEEQGYVALQ